MGGMVAPSPAEAEGGEQLQRWTSAWALFWLLLGRGGSENERVLLLLLLLLLVLLLVLVSLAAEREHCRMHQHQHQHQQVAGRASGRNSPDSSATP